MGGGGCVASGCIPPFGERSPFSSIPASSWDAPPRSAHPSLWAGKNFGAPSPVAPSHLLPTSRGNPCIPPGGIVAGRVHAAGQGDHARVPEERRRDRRGAGRAAAGGSFFGGRGDTGLLGGAHGSLTFCIRESVSTMFFSTWSAFFCRRSMSSVSSLLEILGRKREGETPVTPQTRPQPGAAAGAAVTPVGGVAGGGGQPGLPGSAAVRDSLLPFQRFSKIQNTPLLCQEGGGGGNDLISPARWEGERCRRGA